MKHALQFFVGFLLIFTATTLLAQLPPYYNYNTNGTNNSFPYNIAAGKMVQLLYLPADFNQPTPAPSGMITHFWFRVADTYPLAHTYTNLYIRMGRTSLTTLPTGAFYTGTMDTVFKRASHTITQAGGTWYQFTLDTPFQYYNDSSLVLEIGQCAVTPGTGFSSCYTALSGNRRSYNGTGCPFVYGGQGTSVYHVGITVSTVSPLCEQFTPTTFPPTGWTLIFTGTQYWQRNAVSGFGVGSGSARYDMWNSSSGTNQTMQTLTFQPSAVCNPVSDSLIIDMAFSPYQTAQDSLVILTSTDGGTTYSSFRRLGPTQLQTTAPQTTEFTPTAGQWAKRSYALPVGTNKIQFLGKSQFGNHLYLDSICIKSCLTGIIPIGIEPVSYSLSQNYPNPFNPTTNIKFGLPTAGIVKLVVFDVLGREVATLVNEFKGVGQYVVDFDASSLASGIYFYKIEAGDFVETKKMMLIK